MSSSAVFFAPAASSPIASAFSPKTPTTSKTPLRSTFICQTKGHPDIDLQFALHDALEASGVNTQHARAAREGFCKQIQRMSWIERETSIAINRRIDLARAALNIAAEDDALVSHSSVPLPVDAFVERLDDLAMGFFPHYVPPSRSPPEIYLANLENYLYVHQGFRRASSSILSDTRPLYLHSVLTRRSGSAAMLSVIYSETLKMLRLCGFLDFDVELYYPRDSFSLPRGYHKLKSKVSDEPHIMTSQSLLAEILTSLKVAFWPFPYDNTKSLFLRAAYAANCIGESGMVKGSFASYNNVSGLEFASAKAAQHRSGRGVWTSVRFGDMRCALAACERLILLELDNRELRDYSVLLYHCGLYEEALKCLKQYQTLRGLPGTENLSHGTSEEIEDDAVDNLMDRLNLISRGPGWGLPSTPCTNFWGKFSEPW